MFPSLIASKDFTDSIKDRHQVRQCIERFASLDSAGRLLESFARPTGLDDEGERRVRTEEGWIFLA